MGVRAVVAAGVLAFLAIPPPEASAGALPAVAFGSEAVGLLPGESRLVPFAVSYACGERRRIDLEVQGPEWVMAAVEDFDTRGRCAPDESQVRRGEVVVWMLDHAPPGGVSALTLSAVDGVALAEASVDLRVLRSDTVVAVLPPEVLDVAPGGAVEVPIEIVYTSPKTVVARVKVEAPSGWTATGPSPRELDPGEDARVALPIEVAAPASGGSATFEVSVALESRSGRTLATASAPAVAVVRATLEKASLEGAPTEAAGPIPAEAPLPGVALVLAAMSLGLYVLVRPTPPTEKRP